MKDVLIISQNFPPESVGRASRIFQLAKFLKKSHNIKVMCPPPTFPFTKFKKVNDLPRLEKIDELEVIRIKTYQPPILVPSFFQRVKYELSFPIRASFYFLTKLRNTSTIIISTPPASVLLVSFIARLLRKRIVIDVGDLWTHSVRTDNVSQKRRMLRKLLKSFEINCWKNSDVIICNSLVVKNEIEKIIGKKSSTQINYFPFNVDSDLFKKQNTTLLNQIVYIGSFGPPQNLSSLLRAMPLVLKKIPELTLQLYGGGDDELILKKIVKDLKLERSCIFNNPVSRSEIPLILSRSLVGIVAVDMDESLYYMMPTKTFEYLSCGLPVLAYGSSKELERMLQESESGKFVRTKDPKKIAEELIQLVNDKDVLETYSINGRRFIEKNTENTSLAELI